MKSIFNHTAMTACWFLRNTPKQPTKLSRNTRQPAATSRPLEIVSNGVRNTSGTKLSWSTLKKTPVPNAMQPRICNKKDTYSQLHLYTETATQAQLTHTRTSDTRDSRLSYGEDPESLSTWPWICTGSWWTDRQTDRIPVANTRSQQYLPVQLLHVKTKPLLVRFIRRHWILTTLQDTPAAVSLQENNPKDLVKPQMCRTITTLHCKN